MGMAASQARHLALVARKSNCEYEGQQINQARTALANQSANLFNQMLGLNVPVPPSTQNFTKQQYSFTDGMNGSTITNWQQLATPEEEYNYVVTHHYNANVYTGSQKKLADPQVQYSNGAALNSVEMSALLKSLTSARIEYDKIQADNQSIIDNYEKAVKANEEAQEAYNAALTAQQAAREAQEAALTEFQAAQNAVNAYTADGTNYKELEAALNEAEAALTTAQDNAKNIENYVNQNIDYTAVTTENRKSPERTGNGTFAIGEDIYKPYTNLDETTKTNIKNSIDALINNGAISPTFDYANNLYYNETTQSFATINDLSKVVASEMQTLPTYKVGDETVEGSVLNKSKTYNDDIETKTTAYNEASFKFSVVSQEHQRLINEQNTAENAYNSANSVLQEANTQVSEAAIAKLTAETNLANAQSKKEEAETKYGPTIAAYETALAQYNAAQTPKYLGNCDLTLLENLTENQAAELKQVVATMNELGINPGINDCFDADGNYLGGVYEFKLNGKTYYTSYSELNDSFTSGTGINNIDGQTKLNYYNADYIEKKIEKTEKALLETDGSGRFTSVRFEDDTITYSLNMETITDEAAYNDAMNQYNYENAVYDKTIQDINAKTSIIQQQDQQLELRLKQLDTEHNALVAEIEAVSKVVKDNVDSTFKTFGN